MAGQLIRLEEDYRTDYANLGQLANIGEGMGLSAVNRENARRRIVIRCNTQDRDLASAVAEIEQRVQSQVQFRGATPSFPDSDVASESTRNRELTSSLIQSDRVVF